MKHVFTCLVVLCAVNAGLAQSTDYYDRMDHVFGAIDKTKVTSGFLKEFGVRLNEVGTYSGQSSVSLATKS